MKCKELAERIEQIRPDADLREVARLCLLLSNSTANLNRLTDDDAFIETWRGVDFRMQAATDQHAAMTEELEELARFVPQQFTPEQIWVLIRAIKVQSQVLQLYIGEANPMPETAE